MSRKHTFTIAVLLGAVVVAGLLAVSRTVVLGQPAKASTGTDPTIAFRLKRLDRFEASLERKAARLQTAPAPATAPVTVYRSAPVAQTHAYGSDDGHESGYEHGESDD